MCTPKAFIIPAGMGIIIKKGTWHDFPVSCGPPVSAFVLNTEEVVAALASMKEPMPMNHGDCFKLRLSEHWDFAFKFRDPRPPRSEANLFVGFPLNFGTLPLTDSR